VMTRYTSVYNDFIARLGEVEVLRGKAAILERSSASLRHGAEISALSRASVVLLSSHIEAYIKELGEHTLDCAHKSMVPRSKMSQQFFYYVSRQHIDNVRVSSDPEAIAANVQVLFDKELPHWHGVGPIHGPISSQNFNSGFANPTFDKVKAYFARFGYKDFRLDFMRACKARGIILETALNSIVLTRNDIAHGNPTATKTPGEVKEMIFAAKEFCRTVDDIFSRWCKRSLCKIR
jgi:hypothetical protein